MELVLPYQMTCALLSRNAINLRAANADLVRFTSTMQLQLIPTSPFADCSLVKLASQCRPISEHSDKYTKSRAEPDPAAVASTTPNKRRSAPRHSRLFRAAGNERSDWLRLTNRMSARFSEPLAPRAVTSASGAGRVTERRDLSRPGPLRPRLVYGGVSGF